MSRISARISRRAHPDPARRGCPENDSDGDGLLDSQDQCPTTAQGEHPDPQKPGCPDADSDGDGVSQRQDQCPQVRAGAFPIRQKPGCPQPDKDGDSIVDAQDACPDRPGAPDPNPKKHGCPGLVLVKAGQIVILQSVFFANDQDVIQEELPGAAGRRQRPYRPADHHKLAIEGHTTTAATQRTTPISRIGAPKAAMRWLVEHGIDPRAWWPKGYGPLRPIGDNKTLYGRAKNRRVEFHILSRARWPRSRPPPPRPPLRSTASQPPLPTPAKDPSLHRRDTRLPATGRGPDGSFQRARGRPGDARCGPRPWPQMPRLQPAQPRRAAPQRRRLAPNRLPPLFAPPGAELARRLRRLAPNWLPPLFMPPGAEPTPRRPRIAGDGSRGQAAEAGKAGKTGRAKGARPALKDRLHRGVAQEDVQ